LVTHVEVEGYLGALSTETHFDPGVDINECISTATAARSSNTVGLNTMTVSVERMVAGQIAKNATLDHTLRPVVALAGAFSKYDYNPQSIIFQKGTTVVYIGWDFPGTDTPNAYRSQGLLMMALQATLRF